MACYAPSVRVLTPGGTSAVVERDFQYQVCQAVVDFNSDYGAPYYSIWFNSPLVSVLGRHNIAHCKSITMSLVFMLLNGIHATCYPIQNGLANFQLR